MIKYLVLLFNMLALLIYQAIFTEGVTINQTVPATAKAGSEFTVELKITKGSIGGFAKLQQDLPQGFTATAIENSGGSFTFSNQSIKIIWTSLTSQPEFKISYKITVDKTVSGVQTLAGKFSYVDAGNQKQSIGIDAANIEITPEKTEEVVVKKEEPKTDTTTTANKTTTGNEGNKQSNESGNNTGTNTNTNTSADLKKEEESKAPVVQEITSSRTLPAETTGEFTVELTLNKGNVAGYCKLQETLPDGFTAKAIEKNGSEFTFVNNIAKFVWVSISAKMEQVKVSYKVTVDKKANGSKTIEGLFSYIENDETKKYNLEASIINVAVPVEAVVTNTTGNNKTDTTNTTVTTTTTKKEEPTTTTTTTSKDTAKTKPVTTITSAQSNVNYRVQISATHQNVQVSYFQNKYGISEQIYAEMHEGWNKFTLGAFNEYKSARDRREDIRNKGVVGPFVTAYSTGKRITVQEALMITSQQWYR